MKNTWMSRVELRELAELLHNPIAFEQACKECKYLHPSLSPRKLWELAKKLKDGNVF